MTQRPTRRPLTSLLACAVGVAALAGCGAAGVELHPGAAAVVGDRTVSLADVDERTDELCAVLVTAPQVAQQPADYPLGVLRTAVQRGLALDLMADQLAEEYDVDVSVELEAGTESVRAAYPNAEPDQLEAALPAFVGDGHLDLVLVAIGEQDLGAGTDQEAARARGYELGRAWAEENGLESSPAFEQLTLGEDAVEAARDELSVPASDWARRAAAPENAGEAAAATADLPADQRCQS
ncbi:hypothetical protein [Nocardioides pantholopis]|uniref:hypothetical protein n=1 Tax=Nocardioides pantholopis TaxID=2483798 RepID=UPI000F091001|nr:hypothetical protein [Nocardioides pantholopis]